MKVMMNSVVNMLNQFGYSFEESENAPYEGYNDFGDDAVYDIYINNDDPNKPVLMFQILSDNDVVVEAAFDDPQLYKVLSTIRSFHEIWVSTYA